MCFCVKLLSHFLGSVLHTVLRIEWEKILMMLKLNNMSVVLSDLERCTDLNLDFLGL